jgi:hypothetical protein
VNKNSYIRSTGCKALDTHNKSLNNLLQEEEEKEEDLYRFSYFGYFIGLLEKEITPPTSQIPCHS